MKKILIFGINRNADGYNALLLELEKYFDIAFFPLFIFRDRIIERNMYNEETILKILRGENVRMDNYINKNTKKCDGVLLWYNYDMIENFTIKEINFNFIDFINKIRNDYKIINLNWDAQFGNYNKDIPKLFDLTFGVNPFIKKEYDNYVFFNQGFNSKLTYKTNENLRYKCDVSCVITNLYENYGDNKEFSRKKILDELVKSDLTVHIYGPDFLKTIYPNNYKSFISYSNLKDIFSNSLMTLNISPLNEIECDNNFYYSERMAMIYACECIMITNNDFKNFVSKKSYLKIKSVKEIVNQILKIKNNPELYNLYISKIKLCKDKFNYEEIVKNTMIKPLNNLFI